MFIFRVRSFTLEYNYKDEVSNVSKKNRNYKPLFNETAYENRTINLVNLFIEEMVLEATKSKFVFKKKRYLKCMVYVILGAVR